MRGPRANWDIVLEETFRDRILLEGWYKCVVRRGLWVSAAWLIVFLGLTTAGFVKRGEFSPGWLVFAVVIPFILGLLGSYARAGWGRKLTITTHGQAYLSQRHTIPLECSILGTEETTLAGNPVLIIRVRATKRPKADEIQFAARCDDPTRERIAAIASRTETK